MADVKKYNAFPNRVRMVRRFRYGHFSGWFYDDTYRANIEIIWPVTGRRVARFIKRRYGMSHEIDDEFGAKCVEVLTPAGNEINVICLREWDAKSPSDLSMLAHEAFHAAEHILSKRSIRLTNGNTEPYAYLIESIMLRCLQILKG